MESFGRSLEDCTPSPESFNVAGWGRASTVHPAGGADRFLDPTPERQGTRLRGTSMAVSDTRHANVLCIRCPQPHCGAAGGWRMTCLLGARDEDAVACAKKSSRGTEHSNKRRNTEQEQSAFHIRALVIRLEAVACFFDGCTRTIAGSRLKPKRHKILVSDAAFHLFGYYSITGIPFPAGTCAVPYHDL